jgi:hypothetical protein
MDFDARGYSDKSNFIAKVREICSKKDLVGLHDLIQKEVSALKKCHALHIAAVEGFGAGMEEMIKAGLDINAKDDDGDTPIMTTIGRIVGKGRENESEVNARLLIALGADLNPTGTGPFTKGFTPLILAARNLPGIVPDLISHGACLEAFVGDGWTAFLDAVSSSKLEMVKLLLKHGANCKACLRNGKNPLNIALDKIEFLKGGQIVSKAEVQKAEEMVAFIRSLGLEPLARGPVNIQVESDRIINSLGMEFLPLDPPATPGGKNIYLGRRPVSVKDWLKLSKHLREDLKVPREGSFIHDDSEAHHEFIECLSTIERHTGLTYRLPTLKEWLWAAHLPQNISWSDFENAFDNVYRWGISIALETKPQLAWAFSMSQGDSRCYANLEAMYSDNHLTRSNFPEFDLIGFAKKLFSGKSEKSLREEVASPKVLNIPFEAMGGEHWELVTSMGSVMHDCMWEDQTCLFGVGGNSHSPKSLLEKAIPIFALMDWQSHPPLGFRLVLE